MSDKITIGTAADGRGLELDLLRLVDSRALVQANSGGGKSYLLRGLAEQAAGKLQTVILDPEGEFATLRERVDLLLVGREGEIRPGVRGAKLLARKLVELNVSAVVDLYDLRLPERREFVRDFCESLLSMPRAAWHPMLVAIDECHLFAPERSAGQSVATEAVIGLASQGRKRGIGLIALTQRLSKLHKDAAAELNTVFVGRTWLPNDQESCGSLLGMSKAERGALRDLEPGEFFAFGPALEANGVVRFRSAEVLTSHPKAGERHKATPPEPSKVIREIAAALADLPAQAEAEVNDLNAARQKIHELERRAAAKPAPPPPAEVRRVEVPVLKDADLARAERLVASAAEAARLAGEAAAEIRRAVERAQAPVPEPRRPAARRDQTRSDRGPGPADFVGEPPAAVPRPVRPPVLEETVDGLYDGDALKALPHALLTALAQHPAGLTKPQLLLYAGYAASGKVSKAFAALGRNGWCQNGAGRLAITEVGLRALGNFEPLPTGAALRARILDDPQHKDVEKAILRELFAAYPSAVPKAQLLQRAGYAASGKASKAFGKINRLNWAVRAGGGLKASDDLFAPEERMPAGL